MDDQDRRPDLGCKVSIPRNAPELIDHEDRNREEKKEKEGERESNYSSGAESRNEE